MVDRTKRDAYAEVLRHFAAGLLTNREYEQKADAILSGCKDEAVWQVFQTVWFFYCDIRKHKMKGLDKLSSEGRRLIARCIVFVHSDREYEYRTSRMNWRRLLNLLTLGVWGLLRPQRQPAQPEPQGEDDVWPFFRRQDLEEDTRHP